MNIDIKSVLIGVLLTTSIMLVMGLDSHEKESQIGRYQVVISPPSVYLMYDTTTGKFVKSGIANKAIKEVKNNPNKLD